MQNLSMQTGAQFFAPVFSYIDEYFKYEKPKPTILTRVDDFSEFLVRFSYELKELTSIDQDSIVNKAHYERACQAVFLKFLFVNTNLYEKFIKSEEHEKVLQLYQRKQFNSKLLQALFIDFLRFYRWYNYNYCSKKNGEATDKLLKNLFKIPFLEELEVQATDEVHKEFMPLKKIIEKVAAGVASNCYLQTNTHMHFRHNCELEQELNKYAIEKYNYNIYDRNFSLKSTGYISSIYSFQDVEKLYNEVLQTALLDNKDFWKQHTNFNICQFLNCVYMNNSIKHAQKIIDYIFANLLNTPNCKLMLDNQLSLVYAKKDSVIEGLEAHTKAVFFKQLNRDKFLQQLEEEQFCYPLAQTKNVEEKLQEGKALWDNFVQKYLYPHAYEKFTTILLQEIDSVDKVVATHKTEVHAGYLLDLNFGWPECEDRVLMKAYCPDAFTTENILNRVYLKVYAAQKCIKDENKTYQFLHKIYLHSIDHFAKKHGIFTIQQLDNTKREECYIKLKKILKIFDLQPQEKNKEYYITALLDRDIAMLQEIENFAMLEQLGDAIYNFVVAELLFYNPNLNNYVESYRSKYDLYIQAQTQVQISKKYGFDSAFFALEWIEQTAQKEKYLADSLEMIIGAVYLDLGAEVAIQFVQRILKESFSDDFREPLYFSQCIEQQELYKEYGDEIGYFDYIDYLEIIMPTSFIHAACRNDRCNNYQHICEVVQKVLLAMVIGTDTKEKRNMITYSYCGNLKLFNIQKSLEQNWLLYYYLKDGLLPTIERYKDIVLVNFKKQEKEM